MKPKTTEEENQIDEPTKKDYKFIIRLRNPRTYINKLGESKTFDTYFATAIDQSELFPNMIEITSENQNGTKKISVSKDDITSLEEVGL